MTENPAKSNFLCSAIGNRFSFALSWWKRLRIVRIAFPLDSVSQPIDRRLGTRPCEPSGAIPFPEAGSLCARSIGRIHTFVNSVRCAAKTTFFGLCLIYRCNEFPHHGNSHGDWLDGRRFVGNQHFF
jgi:hypothetical protein